MAEQNENVQNAGLQMELIDKQGKVAFQGNDGQTSVLMKGVKSIADGDYSVVFTDGYVTSPVAKVPATGVSASSLAGSSSTPASSASSVNKNSSADSSSNSKASSAKSGSASSATK